MLTQPIQQAHPGLHPQLALLPVDAQHHRACLRAPHFRGRNNIGTHRDLP